jgi:hypothetical protein
MKARKAVARRPVLAQPTGPAASQENHDEQSRITQQQPVSARPNRLTPKGLAMETIQNLKTSR